MSEDLREQIVRLNAQLMDARVRHLALSRVVEIIMASSMRHDPNAYAFLTQISTPDLGAYPTGPDGAPLRPPADVDEILFDELERIADAAWKRIELLRRSD